MQDFLAQLFDDAISDDRRVCVFTLPDRRARHFASPKAAALYAAREARTRDVYFGVGLAGSNFGRRNSAQDIVAIGGLWADIDLAAPWRADKRLPQTLDQARAILDRLPIPASILIDSGHGLHAWWVFKEPWIFEAEDERIEAAKIAKGWHGAACRATEALGWKMENLGDLARVMRPPGTWNRKGDRPVEVRIIEEHPDRRYNPCDFEDFAAEDVALKTREVESNGLVLRADAEPPADKFSALLLSCPAFAQAWNRQRPDLKDQSQSAYDMSLADIAAMNGWTDQEMASLIIAVRRKHGLKPEKALRADYIAMTLASARQAAEERKKAGVDRSELTAKTPGGPKCLKDLIEAHPSLRKPVIEGLLREGETMNVISAPKIGKSWLVIDLALAVATGRPWLGMDCVPGEVLVIDNELHGETSANRIPRVAAARGIDIKTIGEKLYVENLRGRLQDLFALGPYFRQFEPGRFKVVILDAFYRFLPMRADENDNGTMASLYNYLDSFADDLNCCFVLIHHTSKGNQSLKAITDVGAGAGAQSRATDTHLILRRHQEDDAVVLDAAVRSWPPVPPRCLRWVFPVWLPADDLDPWALRQASGKQKSNKEEKKNEPPSYDPASFAERFLGEDPKSQARIHEEAEDEGLSVRRIKRLLDLAEEDGLAFRWTVGPRRSPAYATVPPPEAEFQNSRAMVEAVVGKNPEMPTTEVAKQCDVSIRYVQQIRRELEANKGANSDAN